MERESCSSVPRRKEATGYGEGKLKFCTLARGSSGVWRGKVAILYPGAREHRGMERESCSSVPRREGTSGYGEGKWQFCTPAQRSNGVWERKVAVLYPAAKKQRGMERESCSAVPRREGTAGYEAGGKRTPRNMERLKYYEESGRKNEGDGRNH